MVAEAVNGIEGTIKAPNIGNALFATSLKTRVYYVYLLSFEIEFKPSNRDSYSNVVKPNVIDFGVLLVRSYFNCATCLSCNRGSLIKTWIWNNEM